MISGIVNLNLNKKLHVASFYRPPKRTDDTYTDQATAEIRDLKNKAKGNILIIGGDFNLPDINWENTTLKGTQYTKKMNEKYLK